ncbi:MAG: hypothetical protein PHS44_01570 [Candidatus Dojkabacteria bacterium]|nr:hypothetical protein [Candidatus Dojkabacteria bacterium]
MKTLIRLSINFVVTAVVILLFRHLNWIGFDKPPVLLSDPTLNDILIAGIIGFILFVVGEIAEIGYKALIVMTCGLMCLFYPFFGLILGYIKLLGTQVILPDWFTFDHTWWKVILMSIAIGLFRIPTIKAEKKIIVKHKKHA